MVGAYGVRGGTTGMESDSGEFENRRNSVRLDFLSSEITWSFKVLDVNNCTSHPSFLSGGTSDMTISGVGQRNVLIISYDHNNSRRTYSLSVSPESRSTQPPSILLIDIRT